MEEARDNLRGVVERTPLTRSSALSESSGAEVFLKWENLQLTGSFKLRGAYNLISSLSAAERGNGLVTASAGNHGAAVAYVARKLGLGATIVVPETATPFKVQRCRLYGADVRVAGATYDESFEVAKDLADREGMVLIPAT
ncbi:MAG: pyridoxal-phosphate dependent enzyme, partial [Thermoplasmata archaeon]